MDNQFRLLLQFSILEQTFKMSIMDYFRTTNKGIYLMEALPSASAVTRLFFSISLGLQILFTLVFIGIFGFTVMRAVKKIKNPKFKTQSEEQPEEDQDDDNADNANNEEETNAKDTNDNLIYRFDEEDHEKEKNIQNQENLKKQEEAEEQVNSQEQYNKEHDQHQQRFLQIDNQLLFLQPFLIGAIVCNNVFATDFIAVGLTLATIILFIIFNVKGACSDKKWLSFFFMIPAFGSFIPVFINDHNMST